MPGPEVWRVRGVRRALVRLALAATAGFAAAWLLPAATPPGMRQVTGWNAAALVFLVFGWVRITTADVACTRTHAAAEDPGRTLVWGLVLASSAFSLFAALVVLRDARHEGERLREIVVGSCLLAVGLAWALTHTAYALRYAHLFYRDDQEGVGGLEFPGGNPPSYFDFAYFAFTVGMCFQVSDVTVSSSQIRRAALGHALLSFVYNTTIMALALNLVIGLLG